LDAPDSGRVAIRTEDEDSVWAEAVPSIALQTPGAAPDLTVDENLQLFARLWGIGRKGRSSRIARFREMLELAEQRKRIVRDLSYGERIRLELARALLPESPITIIDSHLETLSERLRRSVWKHLHGRARAGAAIIVGTASAREAELCERLAVLRKGRLVFVGPPEELTRSVGPEKVVVQAVRPPLVSEKIKEKLGIAVQERDGGVVFATSEGSEAARRILGEMGSDISAVYLRRPSLADALEEF